MEIISITHIFFDFESLVTYTIVHNCIPDVVVCTVELLLESMFFFFGFGGSDELQLCCHGWVIFFGHGVQTIFTVQCKNAHQLDVSHVFSLHDPCIEFSFITIKFNPLPFMNPMGKGCFIRFQPGQSASV